MRSVFVRSTILVVLLLVSCGERDLLRAVGPNGEISVFMNVPSDGPLAETLHGVFSREINVVSREEAFYLDIVSFDEFRVHRSVKNQIFAVDLSRDDALARAVPGMIGAAARRHLRDHRPFRLLVRDHFAEGQTSLFILGWSEADLVQAVSEVDGLDLLRRFDDTVVHALVKTMYSLGEQTVVPRQLAQEFNWTVRLPLGYYTVTHPEGNFVKFNTQKPDRLLLVHWEDGKLPLDTATWDPIMARILDVYDDGDFVEAVDTQSYLFPDRGAQSLRWEGVWQNEKYTIGGGFRARAFHLGGRSFLCIAIVYSPGGEKLPYLRQLEAIEATLKAVS